MPVILKNNASSTLATAITTSDTGVVVANGSQFPAIAAGEYFYVTLVSQAGQTEIVKVTARVGNSMTVVRAQDGSSAASFQVGTLVDMRVNAATVNDLADEHDQDIDRAINGQLTLVLTGTSSTLTASAGVFADEQYKMLLLSGTPSGTHTITISPNTVQKIYFVQNNTTKSVVFTQGSGGDVTIPPSDSAIIYCDGATATARVQNLTTNLSLAPAFTVPREYGVVGDGVTDDTTDFEEFVFGAETAVVGLIPPAVYRIGDSQVNDAINARIVGAPGAVLERKTGATNMFTLRDPLNMNLDGLTLDGRHGTLGTNGHGLVLIDAMSVTVDRLNTTDFGGEYVTNGGAGILAYEDANAILDKIRVTRSNFEGVGVSESSFGIIMANSEFSTITECHSANMGNWGLEFKDGAAYNVLANSTGNFNRYGFGIGYESAAVAHNNVFSGLTSLNCDFGLNIAQGVNNVITGLSAHAASQPDTFGNGRAYCLQFEQNAHENLAVGVLASGAVMDYPVRIRGDRNVVSIADYSDAARTVTFDDGAQENYVEVLHIGEKANSIVGLVEDLNAVFIKRGDGANVVDSPLTREYFGSIRGNMKWGMDGYTNNYVHFSTTSFCFEGFNGATKLGLGVKDGGESGVVVSNETAANIGTMLYVHTPSLGDYWAFGVGGTSRISIGESRIAPITANTIDLGSFAKPFANAYINQLSMKLPVTPTAPALANGCLGFQAMSDTSVRLQFRGSDGVLRYSTLTFA